MSLGEALDLNAYLEGLRGCDTLVHLVGVAHPSPSKADEFRRLDLAAACLAADAARSLRLPHFVYVSVAQPAPVMKAYAQARREGEAHLGRTGVPSTILRPWYVLGPGHWWPLLLLPLYAVASLTPGLRGGARRLGLVSLQQMIHALVHAVEHPATRGQSIIDVPRIRGARLG